MMRHTLLDLPTWVMLATAGIAAIADLRTGLISNRLLALGAGAAIVAQVLALETVSVAGLGWLALRVASGALLCGLVPLLLYLVGGLGGGDVKLFAAIGAAIGPLRGLDVQLCTYLFALCALPLYLAARGRLRSTLRNSAILLRNVLVAPARRRAIPELELTTLRFAPAIFAATCWVALTGSVAP